MTSERAGKAVVCQERSCERREPAVRSGHRILHEQDHQLAPGVLDAEVTGQTMIERSGGNPDHLIDTAAKELRRPVRRGRVNCDDLEREVHPLALD